MRNCSVLLAYPDGLFGSSGACCGWRLSSGDQPGTGKDNHDGNGDGSSLPTRIDRVVFGHVRLEPLHGVFTLGRMRPEPCHGAVTFGHGTKSVRGSVEFSGFLVHPSGRVGNIHRRCTVPTGH